MNTLAYIALGILVERCKAHLRDPERHNRGMRFATIWDRVEHIGEVVSYNEMQKALDTLVEAELVEHIGFAEYRFRITRIAYPKTA